MSPKLLVIIVVLAVEFGLQLRDDFIRHIFQLGLNQLPCGVPQFDQQPHTRCGGGTKGNLAHNGVLWNDKELRMEENLPMTSVETDSYVAVQLLEQQKALDFDSLQAMAEKVEGSFVFTVLDKDNSIWFVVGDNPLCVMFYDGFLIYASTQEITLQKPSKSCG